MSDETRLYGLPGADRLHFEIVEVWKLDIAPYICAETLVDSWEVEEWTVCDPRSHLPSAERVIDYALNLLEELDEYAHDAFDNAANEAEIESMLAAWASRVTYRMTDANVATHRITLIDVSGRGEPQPFLNGEPLYVDSTFTRDAQRHSSTECLLPLGSCPPCGAEFGLRRSESPTTDEVDQ